jgi:hypothetical protein
MDGFLTKKTIKTVSEILESSRQRKKMVTNNYRIATRHYSYSVLRNQLTAIIRTFLGDSVEPLSSGMPSSGKDGYLFIDPHVVMYKRDDIKSCRRRA